VPRFFFESKNGPTYLDFRKENKIQFVHALTDKRVEQDLEDTSQVHHVYYLSYNFVFIIDGDGTLRVYRDFLEHSTHEDLKYRAYNNIVSYKDKIIFCHYEGKIQQIFSIGQDSKVSYVTDTHFTNFHNIRSIIDQGEHYLITSETKYHSDPVFLYTLNDNNELSIVKSIKPDFPSIVEYFNDTFYLFYNGGNILYKYYNDKEIKQRQFNFITTYEMRKLNDNTLVIDDSYTIYLIDADTFDITFQ
jgi:hypothetical protein